MDREVVKTTYCTRQSGVGEQMEGVTPRKERGCESELLENKVEMYKMGNDG